MIGLMRWQTSDDCGAYCLPNEDRIEAIPMREERGCQLDNCLGGALRRSENFNS